MVLCKYSIDLGVNVIQDSSWFQIGLNKNHLLQSAAQHLIADFSIDYNKYRIGVIDDNSSTFDFFRPVLCTLMDNGVNKDTILMRDIVNYGEYVKLGKDYYKFHDIYNLILLLVVLVCLILYPDNLLLMQTRLTA